MLETPQQGLAKVQVGVEIYRNDGHVIALLGAQHRHGAHDEGGISNHAVDVFAGQACLWKVSKVLGRGGSPVPSVCGDDGQAHATKIRHALRGAYPYLHELVGGIASFAIASRGPEEIEFHVGRLPDAFAKGSVNSGTDKAGIGRGAFNGVVSIHGCS